MFNVSNVKGFSGVLKTGNVIFIGAVLTKYYRKKLPPVKITNKTVKNKTGIFTPPINSKQQPKTRLEPLLPTEYPSGMSGIPLQNHFGPTNIPMNLSVDNLVKKEPEDFKINPDLVKFKQICQQWKNFEGIFKQRYPVIDRTFLWTQFWNQVLFQINNHFVLNIFKA